MQPNTYLSMQKKKEIEKDQLLLCFSVEISSFDLHLEANRKSDFGLKCFFL